MMLKVIFFHGPDVDRNVKFLRAIKSSFPVQSFTKLFLLGDPAAGKSTLAKNFKDLASSFFLPSLVK